MLTRYALFLGIILSLSGLLAACATPAAPTPAPAIAALPSQPAPAASATPSPAPSPTEAPTATPPATPTEAPTPTPPATATPAPSPTPSPRPTEAPKPTATKEAAAVIPEGLFPRYGVFMGPLMDDKGADVGRMVLLRLPGATPAQDKYGRCMWYKDDGGWVGCGFFVLVGGKDGIYSQPVDPPGMRMTGFVFEKGGGMSGSVRRPRAKVGDSELRFSLTSRGIGKESAVATIRQAFLEGLRKDVYSDNYISKFLKDQNMVLP